MSGHTPFGDDFPPESPPFFSTLPREFQVIQESRVPLLQILSPGRKGCDEDFIIIAEFSEIEGPIPLATIPLQTDHGLDLNNFVVHLMSTDYQVNSVGPFKITEDTQVLRKNVFKDVHVFMEYLTLYDIKARGFVRPFCFGYVSKDHVKLDLKLEKLIRQFDKITRVLKYSNRKWFAEELCQYLDKLGKAKDSCILDKVRGDRDVPDQDDAEAQESEELITLEQIVHQYTEIQNILTTIVSYTSTNELRQELEQLSSSLSSSYLIELLNRLELIPSVPPKSISPLNIPLVHPLKSKGESLRPLTTLGQIGSVYLIWKLSLVHNEHFHDLIFSQMSELSSDFQKYCNHVKNKSLEKSENPIKINDEIQIGDILEKIHSAIAIPYSSRSRYISEGSFHSVSEQSMNTINPSSSVPSEDKFLSAEENSVFGTEEMTMAQTLRESVSSIASSSQSGENPLPTSPDISTEEFVPKKSWWNYAEDAYARGQPGHGLLKFFRRFSKIAHHIFYSILIGRPIIVTGTEEDRPRISRLLNALIPLVPNKNGFHILRWHRGIILDAHIKRYALIGLCIPERMNIHDLISSRDQNSVTIFGFMKRNSILGPAYSGELLNPFDGADFAIQKRFVAGSDPAFLTFVGGILAEIEAKVYMLKSIQEKSKNKKKSFNFKDISVKASDVEIIRYLSSIVKDADDVLGLF